ncbi:hypothetical protein [Leptospira santarosai]|uniref:hypothetical protein n=1 Tax=Leptospira santarosai TaxID=28183 RepID=UPI001E4C17F7|nr:hypothetical protein [Leptospira santarosai]MDI7184398.1 hypothetical protein [Leptospira santarosai]
MEAFLKSWNKIHKFFGIKLDIFSEYVRLFYMAKFVGISQTEALRRLEPIINSIWEVFDFATGKYYNDFLLTGTAATSSKRSVACNLSDLLWKEMKEKFSNREINNIFLREANGAKFLQYEDLIIRIKKIDKFGRAGNAHSHNSEQFYSELFDFALFNDQNLSGASGINLTLGYIPNDARTEFDYFYLVHPKNRNGVHWIHKIERSVPQNIVTDIHEKFNNENAVDRTLKLKLKNAKDKKKQKKSS